jgi:hypothetical protein
MSEIDCEIDNLEFRKFSFKTQDIGILEEYEKEIKTSDRITIDGQVTASIQEIDIEKYKDYYIIRVLIC